MIPHESVKTFLVLSHGACLGDACGTKSKLRSRQLHMTKYAVVDVVHPIAVYSPHCRLTAYRSSSAHGVTLSSEQLHNVSFAERIISERYKVYIIRVHYAVFKLR